MSCSEWRKRSSTFSMSDENQPIVMLQFTASCDKSWTAWRFPMRNGGGSAGHLGADHGAIGVDGGETLVGLHVPESPAVAGLEPLRQRADAVNGTDAFAEADGAVGAHQRLVPALGVDEVLARQHQAALHQSGKGDARRLAGGFDRSQGFRRQRCDRSDAFARGLGISGIALDADKAAAELSRHRAGGAGAREGIEYEIVRPRR